MSMICNIRRLFCAVCAAVAAAVCPVLVSCDEHDPLDLNIYPGYVLCDDHQVMSLEDYKAQLGGPHSSAAVGVIFATANSEHKTLAVMLFESRGVPFTDYIPLKCGTSCDVKACDGYANTVSMNNTSLQVKYKVEEPDPADPSRTVTVEHTDVYCSPLGQWVFASHEFGQSDYIPSYAEARLLHGSITAVNATIRALGGEEISVSPDDGGCWYWTSTEDADDPEKRAWLCSMGTGGFQQTPKTEFHRARAVVALSY